MRHLSFLLLSFFWMLAVTASPIEDAEVRQLETQRILERSLQFAAFYELSEGIDLKEITRDLLDSPFITHDSKEAIQAYDRRIYLFTYPSDGLRIKGVVSFVPDAQAHPSLVFLRGGNKVFGLLNPASDFMCAGKYTVIATTYRGGVSEGVDEYGGADVNDVRNLMDYLPELEMHLGISFYNEKMYLVGSSRGGMEMFLALGRFPELQNSFKKIVSLCGLLDLEICLLERSDMREMFIDDFGLMENVNETEWMASRNPLLMAGKIRPDCPF